MPTQTADRSIEAQLEAARAALAAAERDEASASAAVTASREGFVLERLTRRALLATQRSLADRQEETEMAKVKVRVLTGQLDREAEAATASRNREALERQKRARAAFADLATKVGGFVADTRAGFGAIEAAARAVNRSEGAATLMAPFRPPSDFPVIYAHLMDSLARLAEVYPKPAAIITPSDTNQRES